MNKKAGNLTIPKLITIIMVATLVIVIIIGTTTKAFNPAIDFFKGKFYFVQNLYYGLFGETNDDIELKNTKEVTILGETKVLNLKDEKYGDKCTLQVGELGLFALDYSREEKPILWYENSKQDIPEENKWRLVDSIILGYDLYQRWTKQDLDELNLRGQLKSLRINIDGVSHEVFLIQGGLASRIDNQKYIFYKPRDGVYLLNLYTDSEGLKKQELPRGNTERNTQIKNAFKQLLEDNSIYLNEEEIDFSLVNLLIKDTEYFSYGITFEKEVFRKFIKPEKELQKDFENIKSVLENQCG